MLPPLQDESLHRQQYTPFLQSLQTSSTAVCTSPQPQVHLHLYQPTTPCALKSSNLPCQSSTNHVVLPNSNSSLSDDDNSSIESLQEESGDNVMCAPSHALTDLEDTTFTEDEVAKFRRRKEEGYNLDIDWRYSKWLKLQSALPSHASRTCTTEFDDHEPIKMLKPIGTLSKILCKEVSHIKVPTLSKPSNARVITSEENRKRLMDKEMKKQAEAKRKEVEKMEREKKRKEKEENKRLQRQRRIEMQLKKIEEQEKKIYQQRKKIEIEKQQLINSKFCVYIR